jgi:hypothetical protein
MAIDHGRPPKGGLAKLVSELLVADLGESLYFWREALGFENRLSASRVEIRVFRET